MKSILKHIEKKSIKELLKVETIIYFSAIFIIIYILSSVYLLKGIPISTDSFRYFTLRLDIILFKFPVDEYLVPLYSFLISINPFNYQGLLNSGLVFQQSLIFFVSGVFYFSLLKNRILEENNKYIFIAGLILFFNYWNIKYTYIAHADSIIGLSITLYIYIYNLQIELKKRILLLSVFSAFFSLVKLNLVFIPFSLFLFCLVAYEGRLQRIKLLLYLILPYFSILSLYFSFNGSFNLHADFFSEKSYWDFALFKEYLVINIKDFLVYSSFFIKPSFVKFNLAFYFILFWIIPAILFLNKKVLLQDKEHFLLLWISINSYYVLLILMRSVVGLAEVSDRTLYGFFYLYVFYLIFAILILNKIFVNKKIFIIVLSFILILNMSRSFEHVHNRFKFDNFYSFKIIEDLEKDDLFLILDNFFKSSEDTPKIFSNNTPLLDYFFYKKVILFGLPYDKIFKGNFFIDPEVDLVNLKKEVLCEILVNGDGIIVISKNISFKNSMNEILLDTIAESMDLCSLESDNLILLYHLESKYDFSQKHL